MQLRASTANAGEGCVAHAGKGASRRRYEGEGERARPMAARASVRKAESEDERRWDHAAAWMRPDEKTKKRIGNWASGCEVIGTVHDLCGREAVFLFPHRNPFSRE